MGLTDVVLPSVTKMVRLLDEAEVALAALEGIPATVDDAAEQQLTDARAALKQASELGEWVGATAEAAAATDKQDKEDAIKGAVQKALAAKKLGVDAVPAVRVASGAAMASARSELRNRMAYLFGPSNPHRIPMARAIQWATECGTSVQSESQRRGSGGARRTLSRIGILYREDTAGTASVGFLMETGVFSMASFDLPPSGDAITKMRAMDVREVVVLSLRGERDAPIERGDAMDYGCEGLFGAIRHDAIFGADVALVGHGDGKSALVVCALSRTVKAVKAMAGVDLSMLVVRADFHQAPGRVLAGVLGVDTAEVEVLIKRRVLGAPDGLPLDGYLDQGNPLGGGNPLATLKADAAKIADLQRQRALREQDLLDRAKNSRYGGVSYSINGDWGDGSSRQANPLGLGPGARWEQTDLPGPAVETDCSSSTSGAASITPTTATNTTPTTSSAPTAPSTSADGPLISTGKSPGPSSVAVTTTAGNGSPLGSSLVQSVKAVSSSVSKRRGDEDVAAGVVFGYWQEIMNKPRAVFDANRRGRIIARLRENKGDIGELLFAIDGAERDDWLMGRDAKSAGRKYNDIDTVLRDRSQVERLAERIPAYQRGDEHPVMVAMAKHIQAQEGQT